MDELPASLRRQLVIVEQTRLSRRDVLLVTNERPREVTGPPS